MIRPVLVVFAGVNGSGKSTFYHSGAWRNENMPKTMHRVIQKNRSLAQRNAVLVGSFPLGRILAERSDD